MYQIVTEKKCMFFDKQLSKLSEFYYLKPGLYPSVADNVEAMNTLIQQRHNLSENCITVKPPSRKQKIEIYVANEGFGLAFCSTDLRHIFGTNLGKEFE